MTGHEHIFVYRFLLSLSNQAIESGKSLTEDQAVREARSRFDFPTVSVRSIIVVHGITFGAPGNQAKSDIESTGLSALDSTAAELTARWAELTQRVNEVERRAVDQGMRDRRDLEGQIRVAVTRIDRLEREARNARIADPGVAESIEGAPV